MSIYPFRLGETSYAVRIGQDGLATVEVPSRPDGADGAVHIRRLDEATFEVRDERDRWRRTVHVVATEKNDSSKWWVFSEGEVFEFTRTQDGPTTHRLDESPSLSSPMPATVRQVHVSSGQEVRVGDTLILLEAMKMEMPLKAPRDGVVESVACQEGDLVTPGTPLVVLEPVKPKDGESLV